ncbi:MAG TPA: hypothetical protein VMH87_15335 [Pseudomonadales bacterium]|nr:hypothetical protein [Pseudomonadales bacterium]
MQSLANQRCFNHAAREAVARCPECRQFFCRECITEHDDRVVCAACLARIAHKPLTQRLALVKILWFTQAIVGLFIAWYFFFLIGEGLLKLPNSFHEGTLWQVNWINQQ